MNRRIRYMLENVREALGEARVPAVMDMMDYFMGDMNDKKKKELMDLGLKRSIANFISYYGHDLPELQNVNDQWMSKLYKAVEKELQKDKIQYKP